MRWILSVFAMAYNRRQGRTGHVWGERYFSKILGTLREFETTFRYIDENPVAAGAVPLPWQWRCGGLGHARLGRRDIIGEVADWILLLFPNHAIGLRDG
jgi:putative transposase